MYVGDCSWLRITLSRIASLCTFFVTLHRWCDPEKKSERDRGEEGYRRVQEFCVFHIPTQYRTGEKQQKS